MGGRARRTVCVGRVRCPGWHGGSRHLGVEVESGRGVCACMDECAPAHASTRSRGGTHARTQSTRCHWCWWHAQWARMHAAQHGVGVRNACGRARACASTACVHAACTQALGAYASGQRAWGWFKQQSAGTPLAWCGEVLVCMHRLACVLATSAGDHTLQLVALWLLLLGRQPATHSAYRGACACWKARTWLPAGGAGGHRRLVDK